MPSRTCMLEWVRKLRWKEVAAGLCESPELLAYRDPRGRSFLHLCCSIDVRARGLKPGDAVRTAGVLLDAGLDLDAEAFREGDWKATPLWYAVARGRNGALVKDLLGRGADPNHCLWAAAFRDDLVSIDRLVAAGAVVDPVTENETPFLGAVKTSHFRGARKLLELGADPDFQDTRGMTALHCMLKKRSDERWIRMVVKHGARGDIPGPDGRTAVEIMGRTRSPSLRRLAGELGA